MTIINTFAGSEKPGRSLESALSEFSYYEVVHPFIYHKDSRRWTTEHQV